jgi:hypothetical protein
VLTAGDSLTELRQRGEQKRRWRRKRAAPPPQEEEDPVAAEDEPNFEADDGPEFEGFALAADLTDVEETDAESGVRGRV